MDVVIGSNTYEAFTTVALANTYLAADPMYAVPWAAAQDDAKGRAVVGASRLLVRLPFAEQPDINNPPDALKEATALLAGAILLKPKLAGGASTANNIKRVKAGPAEVEYFQSVQAGDALPVPENVWALLLSAGLLAADIGDYDLPLYIASEDERTSYFCLDTQLRYYGEGCRSLFGST